MQVTGKVVQSIKKRKFFAKLLYAIGSLIKGMRVTFKYLVNPKTVVTRQYPENRDTLKLSERTRSQLVMNHDEKGFHKCTACHICETACPNASIHVVERKGPVTGKTEIDHFIWRLDTCTFCNLCVLSCPFGCLKMNPTFESSVYDQRLLTYNLIQYAGPTANVLSKIENQDEVKKMMDPRTPYTSFTSLEGFYMAGIPGMAKPIETATEVAKNE